MAGLNTMTFPGKPGRAVSRGNSGRGDLPAAGEVAACAGIAGPFSVAFLNRKGGVGKTSCCHHLAGCFARSGRRVLLIDADPQASLTQGLLGPAETERLEKDETIACLFDDAFDPDPEGLVRPTQIEHVWFVPGSAHLDRHNLPAPEEAGALQLTLRTLLDDVGTRFDVTLIDCPPNLYLCSWSALLAADFVVVPFQPEDYGSQGITAIRQAIERARSRHNPGLRLMGYLLTMVQRRLGLHAAYERQLRLLYGEDVFEVSVPRTKDYSEAVSARLPIDRWRPRSVAARAMAALACEMDRRARARGASAPDGSAGQRAVAAGEGVR
jgi:chromosome partitioning protein